MRTIDRIKKEAMESARWRGHTLKRWDTFRHYPNGPRGYFAECVNCNKGVRILLDPMPNEIEIGGSAVALGCDD